ncbi:MAG: alanine--glyoxylate aminotransferase family protein [Anaerovorax sp.]|nr:alanine--glyoxylate aminotransferase family protein [Anaerovorax sp.]
MYKIMTPGPTTIKENVRKARSLETTNSDLDLEFYDYYKETCDLLRTLLHTKNEAYILSGEGILGLEAACASLTEPKDRVLILDNGVFGKGFADFVRIYGGIPVSFVSDYHKPINPVELKDFLEKDSDFKYATVVHCDTPSGVLNDVEAISKLLKEHGILTVVDSVAGMFGEALNVDEAQIDILCGGSQKALSAAVGLTMLWVSPDAIKAMENRSTPIASFYANILNFKGYYEKKSFPYTPPISDIYGIRAALENVMADKEIFIRHEKIAQATRKAIQKSGLQLFLKEGYSNTVTAVSVPPTLTDREILDTIRTKYGIMIAGSFDVLAGKVVRIGHMGENAREACMSETMDALTKTFQDLGCPLKCDLKMAFLEALQEE